MQLISEALVIMPATAETKVGGEGGGWRGREKREGRNYCQNRDSNSHPGPGRPHLSLGRHTPGIALTTTASLNEPFAARDRLRDARKAICDEPTLTHSTGPCLLIPPPPHPRRPPAAAGREFVLGLFTEVHRPDYSK